MTALLGEIRCRVTAIFLVFLAVVLQGCGKSTDPPLVGRSTANVLFQDFASADNRYYVFDTAERGIVDSFDMTPFTTEGHLSADKQRIFIRGVDSIFAIDISSRTRVGGFRAPLMFPLLDPIRISQDGGILAVTVADSGLRIFDAKTYLELFLIPGVADDFKDYSISHSGKRFYVVGKDRRLRVFRIGDTLTIEHDFITSGETPVGVVGSSDGSIVAIETHDIDDVFLEVYDLKTRTIKFQEKIVPSGGGQIEFSRDELSVFLVNPGNPIIGGEGDYSLITYDTRSNSFTHRIQTGNGLMMSYYQTEDGNWLIGATAAGGARITLIDLQRMELDTVIILPNQNDYFLSNVLGEL